MKNTPKTHLTRGLFGTLVLMLLVCASGVFAQNVVPDGNFRACLKAAYPDAFDGSDEVILLEAEEVTLIFCPASGIDSLDGIEYFVNASTLDLSDNDLQDVNQVTALVNLLQLNVSGNQITSLPDLSALSSLQVLYAANNLLTTLPDLSANTSLEELSVSENAITSLPDLSANTALQVLDISMTSVGTFPDLSNNASLTHLWFSDNPQFNTFPDLTANVNLTSLVCAGNALTSISDLSAQPGLTLFNCSNNNLSSLPDLSANTALNELYCSNNNLAVLPELSHCLALQRLECADNNLNALPDLSNNTNLSQLSCGNNNLTDLPDLANTQIGLSGSSVMLIQSNQLTFEDLIPVSQYAALAVYDPQSTVTNDVAATVPEGTDYQIELGIDEGVITNVYTWYKDGNFLATTSTGIYSITDFDAADQGVYTVEITNSDLAGLTLETGTITLDMSEPMLIPDAAFRACLKEMYPNLFDENDYLIPSEVLNVTEINCASAGIQSFEGIEYFTNATYMNLNMAGHSVVPDLSGFASLESLSISFASLGGNIPDFSANTALEELSIFYCGLTSPPDLSGNTNLRRIIIIGNQFTSPPDVSMLSSLEAFFIDDNPILNLPDFSNNPALYTLGFANTQLPSFPDLSAIPGLRAIDFSRNPHFGTFPDLSTTPLLEVVNCNNNALTSIPDLGYLTAMYGFYCSGNSLTALPDLSLNPSLRFLECQDNQLIALPDLSENLQLSQLNCSNNQLISIPDLSATQIGTSLFAVFNGENNRFTFEDIVPFSTFAAPFTNFDFYPQQLIEAHDIQPVSLGNSITLTLNIDQNVSGNQYYWYKDGVYFSASPGDTLIIENATPDQSGNYVAVVTNFNIPGILLQSEVFEVVVNDSIYMIPDANFRGCLQSAFPAIFDGNGGLSAAGAATVTEIECWNENIQSIDGIRFFHNAVQVDISSNLITDITELSTLPNLRVLAAAYNLLTSPLDFSANPALEQISLAYNNLTEFPDLSSNSALEGLTIRGNQISSLPDLSMLPNLEILTVSDNPISVFPDFSSNTAIRNISFADVALAAFPDLSPLTNLNFINFSANPQFGSFPDLTAHPDLLSITCWGNEYSSMPSLAFAPNLQWISCFDNKLTALPDLSGNFALQAIECQRNELTTLPDFSHCSSLWHLNCEENKLTQLPDFSSNNQLTSLYCSGNQLTDLPDLSGTLIATAINSSLVAYNNKLTFEDIVPVSGYPTFSVTNFQGQDTIAVALPPLIYEGENYTIDLGVDEGLANNVYTWYKDGSVLTTTTINALTISNITAADNGTYMAVIQNSDVPGITLQSHLVAISVVFRSTYNIPDPQFRGCLQASYPNIFDSSGRLIVDDAKDVTNIHCVDMEIERIDGIQFFEGVEHLNLELNHISTIPDSIFMLQRLRSLNVAHNELGVTLPNFLSNTMLEQLDLSFNDLTEVPYLPQNGVLRVLNLQSNRITEFADLTIYPQLGSLVLNNNPLAELGSLDGNLMLDSLSISNVALPNFPKLSDGLNLSFIDFSHNPQFEVFPDLSGNINLHSINCSNNGFTGLPDLSIFENLTALNCSFNLLTEIPVESNANLETFICHNNLLTALPDLSNTKVGLAQSTLIVNNNRLTFEDIIPLQSLTFLELLFTPQLPVTPDTTVTLGVNASFTFDLAVDNSVTGSVYQWFKNGTLQNGESNLFRIATLNEGHAGDYRAEFTNALVPGLTLNSGITTLVVDASFPPWEPVKGGTKRHRIQILAGVESDLNGRQLKSGDFIGVFFNDQNGNPKPGAMLRWEGQELAMDVYGNAGDELKNGFNDNEKLNFMVWTAEGKLLAVDATYDNSLTDGHFKDGGHSGVIKLMTSAICQQIDLYAGWNLISGYVRPEQPAMAEIFGNITNIIVKDASGAIRYAPAFGISSGQWDITEGYLIYSGSQQNFDLCGRRVSPTAPLDLVRYGYPEFMPYYGDVEADVEPAVANLTASLSYMISHEYVTGSNEPRSFLYIPGHGVNQIGKLKPGLAYKTILLNDAPGFAYPENVISNGRKRDHHANISWPKHFKVVATSTLTTAALLIPGEILDGLSIGDEIAAVDGNGDIIGAAVFDGGPVAIVLSDNPSLQEKPGYSIRIWRESDNIEMHAALVYQQGENKFVPNTLSIASGIEILSETLSAHTSIFPNPTNDQVRFTFTLKERSTVKITLVNLMGTETEILNEERERGEHAVDVSLEDFPSGQYVYQIIKNKNRETGKLVVTK